jgi:hypothetical protein
MEAQVPSQKPDFARIVLGCKGLRDKTFWKTNTQWKMTRVHHHPTVFFKGEGCIPKTVIVTKHRDMYHNYMLTVESLFIVDSAGFVCSDSFGCASLMMPRV